MSVPPNTIEEVTIDSWNEPTVCIFPDYPGDSWVHVSFMELFMMGVFFAPLVLFILVFTKNFKAAKKAKKLKELWKRLGLIFGGWLCMPLGVMLVSFIVEPILPLKSKSFVPAEPILAFYITGWILILSAFYLRLKKLIAGVFAITLGVLIAYGFIQW